MLEVVSMAGFATIQDLGRPAHRSDGVPVGGAMDAFSLMAANQLVGNAPNAAGVEWALAGGCIRFLSRARVALTGAHADVTLNGSAQTMNVPIDVDAGDELSVARFRTGMFLYLAVRGGIDVPVLLGSRATFIPAAFGGFEGRKLRRGDRLPIGHWAGTASSRRDGETSTATAAGDAIRVIRVIDGPASSEFSPEFRDEFWQNEFTISPRSNRAGYRLERDRPSAEVFTTGVSEPACVGAIQVPTGGSAIVLMPDGPTVGGYPKIGVVASVDLGVLAQLRPGAVVRFERIALATAHSLLRSARSLAHATAQS